MNCLVSGATGFIGRYLVSTLIDKGHAVSAMIRPGKRLDERLPDGCEQVPVALTDVEKLTGIVANSSAVIYCAGSVRGRTPADFSVANIEGVQAILDALGGVDHAPPLLLLGTFGEPPCEPPLLLLAVFGEAVAPVRSSAVSSSLTADPSALYFKQLELFRVSSHSTYCPRLSTGNRRCVLTLLLSDLMLNVAASKCWL